MDRSRLFLCPILAFVSLLFLPSSAQVVGAVPGQNVNMVSGTVWPAGDPFLQRQDEPSMAVSNRNPEHLLAGANDYRTVDIANPGATDYRGDAWLGVFTSIDGGESWKSTPLPGYPQDASSAGRASPLYLNYNVATDPTVRAGTDGMIYYSGLAFNRGSKTGSAVFVSTFQDLNNKGNGNGAFEQQGGTGNSGSKGNPGNPFLYLNTVIVDTTSNQFVDKPWIAVDIPRPGRTATCNVNGQSFSSGYVYLFYTFFNGSQKNPTAKINVSVSANCGASWSKPQTISQSSQLNQGTVAGIDPGTGNVYVTWRQEGNGTQNQPDQILFAYSTNGGGSWTTGVVYTFPNQNNVGTAGSFDLDENQNGTQFRSEDIPALAVDPYGRLWVAFSQRVAISGPSGSLPGSRIFVTTLPKNGGPKSWTTPYVVDASAPIGGAGATYGHQLMPSFTSAYGRLMLVWLDTRWDNQQQVLSGCDKAETCTISHSPIPNSYLAAGRPDLVFNPNITDPIGGGIRHTIDVFGSMITPSSSTSFNFPTVQAIQISQYKFYFNTTDQKFEQANFNPPNLPMFVQGSQPFIGDYLDVAAVTMVPSGNTWTFNSDISNAPVFHATWTDNRDVVPPPILTGPPQTQDWTKYAAPGGTASSPSIFNPSVPQSDCLSQQGYSGDRNQNIYTSRITSGLIVRFKENAKPLTSMAGPVRRSFSLYVRNTVSALANPNPALYRILIGPTSTDTTKNPTCNSIIAGGTATFADGSCQLDVAIPPRTTISRAIAVNSTTPNASVNVLVAPIDAIPNGKFTGGLQATAALNNFPNNQGAISDPDQITFDASDPDFGSPYDGLITLVNGEVYDPTSAGSLLQCPPEATDCESSPSISSPSISSPSIASPSIASPSIASPSIASPSIASPSIKAVQTASPSIVTIPNSSPSIASPSIASPSIANLENSSPSIANPGDNATDYSFTINNKGNTHSTYNTKEFMKQLGTNVCTPNSNQQCQLIIHRTHGNPTAVIGTNGQASCALAVQVQDQTQANIPNPAFDSSASTDVGSSASNATITLGPGEGTRVTLRVFGNPIDKTTTTFPIRAIAIGSVPNFDNTTPTSLTILTNDLPVAVVGQPYTTNGAAPDPQGQHIVALKSVGGHGATTWSLLNQVPSPTPQPLPVSPLTLSLSGQISTDIVTASPSRYPFDVQVQDSANPVNLDTQSLAVDVNQFSISSVDVQITNTVGGTSYLKAGDVATVTVNVSNHGPITATGVAATLSVNALAGGTPSGPTPNVACVPQTVQLVSIADGGSYPFVFICTANSGDGYISFTGNASGQYVSRGTQYTTQATAGPVTTPTPNSGIIPPPPNTTPPNIVVDDVPPSLTFVSHTAANAFGWNNTAVTFNYTSADNLSGAASTTPVSPATATFNAGQNAGTLVLSTEGDSITGQISVTDFAGNTSGLYTTTPPVMIDLTPPQLTDQVAQQNGNPKTQFGWYNSAVTVTFNCTDPPPASHPNITTSGVNSFSSPVVLSNEGANQSATGNCSDKAGNSSQLTETPINIDLTQPQVAITAPANNVVFTLNQPVATAGAYSCSDVLSGIVNCTARVGIKVQSNDNAAGAHQFGLVTDTVGQFTINASANDQASNMGTAVSVNYSVQYNFTGFQGPLQAAGTPSAPTNSGSFGQGSQVPFQWTLQDFNHAFIVNAAALTNISAIPSSACDGVPTGSPIPLYAPPVGASAFSVNAATGVFTFVLDTTGVATGCYDVVFSLDDTTQHATIVNITPSTTVTGSQINSFYSATGALANAPTDLTSAVINAFVPTGQGTYSILPGQGAADGTFNIPNVEIANYWFHLGADWLWTNESNIDAGFSSEGRPNAIIDTATVNFSVSNMTAWKSGDSLEYWTPNLYEVDSDITPLQNSQYKAPTTGATSYIDSPKWAQGLVDPSQGDQFFLLHLGAISLGGLTFDALEETFSPSVLIPQKPNSTTDFTGNFTQVAQNRTIHLAASASQFAQFAATAGPGATPDVATFGVYITTPAPEVLFGNDDPALFGLRPTAGITADFDLGDAQYGDPFPANYVRYYAYQQNSLVPFMSPGGTQPNVLPAVTLAATLNPPTAAAPISPIVGPVSSITINGSPFTQSMSGVGTTPTLTWQAPTVGSATDYRVGIFKLGVNAAGLSTATLIAHLFTNATSMQIPPGILTAGSVYRLRVMARHRSGVDPRANWSKSAYPFGVSQVITYQLTP